MKSLSPAAARGSATQQTHSHLPQAGKCGNGNYGRKVMNTQCEGLGPRRTLANTTQKHTPEECWQ